MYILFDIGGTKMRIASSVDCKTLNEVKIFPTPVSYDEGIRLFNITVKELTNDEKITVCAGGIAGPLDQKKRNFNKCPTPKRLDWKTF